jgi:hypothetical protein
MQMQPTALRIRALAGRLERYVPRVAIVAAVVGLALVARTQRGALAEIDWEIAWQPFAISTIAFAVAPLTQGLSFWIVLRGLTGTTPLLPAMLVWSRSYVIRYAPTGALAIAYRVSARRTLDATADQVLAAYVYEHIGALAAGAAACLTLFAIAGDLPPLLPLAVALTVLVVTAGLCPGVAGRLLDVCARRVGLGLSIVLPGRQLAAVVAVNAIGWLGTGTAVWVLVSSLTDGTVGLLWLVSSYTAGYLIGFVAPLAPGGLGAREGTLVVLLGPRLGAAAALAISLALRVANIAGELVAVTSVHLAWGISRALSPGEAQRPAAPRTVPFPLDTPRGPPRPA